MWTSFLPTGASYPLKHRSTTCRRRTISSVVLDTRVPLEKLTSRHADAWGAALSEYMLTAGDVVNIGTVQPELCPTANVTELHRQMAAWSLPAGRSTPVALACRGTGFHHDAGDYPDMGFCVLWLSEDAGWDLLFPFLNRRIELLPGTVALFDSAQPHAVVQRGESVYRPEIFENEDLGLFLSQDFLLTKRARKLLQIEVMSRHGRGSLVPLSAPGIRDELNLETGSWAFSKEAA